MWYSKRIIRMENMQNSLSYVAEIRGNEVKSVWFGVTAMNDKRQAERHSVCLERE